eukprot:m.135717 g.135717  ORF g.135717 m.135717 type:complete len:371 (+) comp11422_c0_seq3:310-1422(+)
MMNTPLDGARGGGGHVMATARTWDDVEALMYADEPVNFLLGGETAAPLTGANFPFPAVRDVVESLRRDPDTRILPGRPPKADLATTSAAGSCCSSSSSSAKPNASNATPSGHCDDTDTGAAGGIRAHVSARETTPGALSILETRDGVHHLRAGAVDEAAFAAWFRAAPLDEALAVPFSLAHFQLARFFARGDFLEGFDVLVLEPWKAALRGAGFEFDRCLPYIFISGARDVGSFHHDVSHVVAWQIEGVKTFCGLVRPSELHPESERRKHGQSVSPPAGLTESDVLAVHMPPGTVLFNQLLTPHWVQSPLDGVAFSINLSHGGLRRSGAGRGLCRNEREHEAYKASDPAIAALFDIRRGYTRDTPKSSAE